MLARARYERSLTWAETGSINLEGYVLTSGSGRRLDVVWTEDDTYFDPNNDPQVPLVVNARQLRVVDKYGRETWRNSTTGKITIVVGGSPLYLEYYQ